MDNFRALNTNRDETATWYALAQCFFLNKAALQIVKTLSGGDKMRAALACLLMAERAPQLLMLDEPTKKLDIRVCSKYRRSDSTVLRSNDCNISRQIILEIGITYGLEISNGRLSTL